MYFCTIPESVLCIHVVELHTCQRVLKCKAESCYECLPHGLGTWYFVLICAYRQQLNKKIQMSVCKCVMKFKKKSKCMYVNIYIQTFGFLIELLSVRTNQHKDSKYHGPSPSYAYCMRGRISILSLKGFGGSPPRKIFIHRRLYMPFTCICSVFSIYVRSQNPAGLAYNFSSFT